MLSGFVFGIWQSMDGTSWKVRIVSSLRRVINDLENYGLLIGFC